MFAIVASISLHLNLSSGRTLLALVPVIVLLVGLIVFCLVDLIRAPDVRYLPKPAWALIIILVSAPLGALAYLAFGRNRRGQYHNAVADASDDGRAVSGRDERSAA